MTIRETLKSSLTEAMKAKDELTTATLRLVIAKLREKDIELRPSGNTTGLDDAAIMTMMQSMIKQRQESAETYAKANRPELAARENDEIGVIKRFLPQQMSDEEVRKVIDGLIAELSVKDVKDMGKLMGALKTRYAGKLDMGKASGLIKERLSAA